MNNLIEEIGIKTYLLFLFKLIEMLTEFKDDKKNLESMILDLIKEFEKKYGIRVHGIETRDKDFYSDSKLSIQTLKLNIEL